MSFKGPRLPGTPFEPQQNPTARPAARGAKFDRLNALFSGGARPAAPTRMPAAGGMGPRIRMERLRMASDPAETTAAIDALVANHEIPDDPMLLARFLSHPDAGVGERALAQLGSLHAAGRLMPSGVLRDALEAFAPRCKEPHAQQLLQQLLSG